VRGEAEAIDGLLADRLFGRARREERRVNRRDKVGSSAWSSPGRKKREGSAVGNWSEARSRAFLLGYLRCKVKVR